MSLYRIVIRSATVLLASFLLLSGAVAQQPASPAPLKVSPASPTTPVAVSPATVVTREDWARLPVDRASFKTLEPALGGVDGNDKFSREFIQLQWRDGDPVEVYVIRPKGVVKPPVIVYLYGYKENLDRFKNDRYCERLTAGGYAAIGFESALGVDRFHGRPMKEWFVSELRESLGKSVHDVQMVLDYVDSRKDLDIDHAGIFGQGSGGAIAILASAVDARLKAVDTLNAWGDWKDWLATSNVIPDAERPALLTPEFLEKTNLVEPADLLPKVKASSLRIRFVADTPSIPALAMDRMASAVAHDTPSTAYSVIRYKDMQDLIQQTDGGRLYDWIKDRLKTTSTDTQSKAAAEALAQSEAPSAKQ